MDRVINDEIQKELQIGLYSTEDKIRDIEAGGYNIWKEWKMQEYKSKPSNIHYVQEEVLPIQDGKLMTEQYDPLYPEVRIIYDDGDDDD
jgi:thymidylate synthase